MKLTATGQRLLDAMKAALDSSAWERVPGQPGLCIRYSETGIVTPEIMRRGAYASFETYDRHQFLTMGHTWRIWGVANAPWMGRKDVHVTYRDAFEILASPEKYWSAGPSVLRKLAAKEGG
jgi:hypothetical protein